MTGDVACGQVYSCTVEMYIGPGLCIHVMDIYYSILGRSSAGNNLIDLYNIRDFHCRPGAGLAYHQVVD